VLLSFISLPDEGPSFSKRRDLLYRSGRSKCWLCRVFLPRRRVSATGCASITGEAPPPGPRRLIVEYLTPKIRAMSIKVSPA